MIVLDTNVLAEVLSSKPPRVGSAAEAARGLKTRSPHSGLLDVVTGLGPLALKPSARSSDRLRRNVPDFEHCGLTIVNPWHASISTR